MTRCAGCHRPIGAAEDPHSFGDHVHYHPGCCPMRRSADRDGGGVGEAWAPEGHPSGLGDAWGGRMMAASDDARQAIARAAIADPEQKWQGRKFGIDHVLAAVMPDGRTIAQHLDDGAVAERLLHLFAATDDQGWSDADLWIEEGRWVRWNGRSCDRLADVDPEAAALLARLEADRG